MIRYKITFTKEKNGIIDNDFTMKGEYVLNGEEDLNLDPEPFILEDLCKKLFEYFLRSKDKGDLRWNY